MATDSGSQVNDPTSVLTEEEEKPRQYANKGGQHFGGIQQPANGRLPNKHAGTYGSKVGCPGPCGRTGFNEGPRKATGPQNQKKGAQFEKALQDKVLTEFGINKNTSKFHPGHRTGKARIVDFISRQTGLIEAKNVNKLSNSPQLKDFITFAEKTNQPISLVVGTHTKVYAPVVRAIENANRGKNAGGIYSFNPNTGSLTKR